MKDQGMANKVYVLWVVVLLIGMLSYGCRRDPKIVEDPQDSVACVSIGKIKNLAYDSLDIFLKVDGSEYHFKTNKELASKVLSPNKVVLVGVKVIKDAQEIAGTDSSKPECPYVSRSLSKGVNHITLKLCKQDSTTIETTKDETITTIHLIPSLEE